MTSLVLGEGNWARATRVGAAEASRQEKWRVGQLVARPLTGPLSPPGLGPNPPRIILKRSMKALYGPMDTSKEVRMFSTDVLG